MEKLKYCIREICYHQKLPVFASILVVALITSFCCPEPAAAVFKPNEAVEHIIDFFQLLIVAAAAYLAITLIGKGNIVPAVIAVLGGAFLYVVTDPKLMEEFGKSIKDLITGQE